MESVQQASDTFPNSFRQSLLKIRAFTSSLFSYCFNRLSTTVQSLEEICKSNKKIIITASLASAAIMYLIISRQKPEKRWMCKASQQNTNESSEDQIQDSHSNEQIPKGKEILFSYILDKNSEFYSKQLNRSQLQVVQELSDSEEDDKVFFEIYRGYQETQ